jgi:hypothetical protein
MKRIGYPGRTRVVIASLALLSVMLFFGAGHVAAAEKGNVKRGEYLVNLGGCNDCHSPKMMTAQGPVPDPSRLLSGQPAAEKLAPVPEGLFGPDKWGGLCNNHLSAWVGPWGTSFASNLTPDNETGTGAWTEEMFVRTIRTGTLMGAGRPLLPPMPWQSFAKLTNEDLSSIFAYLRSLKPIRNKVPEAVPAGPPR